VTDEALRERRQVPDEDVAPRATLGAGHRVATVEDGASQRGARRVLPGLELEGIVRLT